MSIFDGLTRDDAALKALPMRVGRMTYEQARALFDEAEQWLDAHKAEVERGAFCTECKWHTERVYEHCTAERALWMAHCDLPMRDTPGRESAHAAWRAHKRTCATCQTVTRELTHLDECAYTSRLFEVRRVANRRMVYLETRQARQRFERVHGRPPANVLELVYFREGEAS